MNYEDCKLVMFEYMENTMHDIKTPMSVIFSALQTLEMMLDAETTPFMGKKGKGNARDAFKCLSAAKRECFSVMRLIREAADVNKLLDRRARPELLPRDLSALVEDVCLSAQIMSAGKNVSVTFSSSVSNALVDLDAQLARRLFMNILSNAIKHSPERGHVRVSVSRTLFGGVSVSVRDEGEGIGNPSEFLTRYATTDGGFGRSGSGLGLAIVKEIAGLFGWRLRFDNAPGGGAICSLECDLSAETQAAPFEWRTVDLAAELV